MFVTRKAEFSASHVCRLASLGDTENRELFGEDANPNGHGHNYIVEATIEGEPDPVTGMVIDLKELKDMLEDHVVAPMDHRFLNYEVPPFDQIVPTTANVAREIWRRLETPVAVRGVRLFRVRVFETPDLYFDAQREDGAP